MGTTKEDLAKEEKDTTTHQLDKETHSKDEDTQRTKERASQRDHLHGKETAKAKEIHATNVVNQATLHETVV